MSLPVAHRLRLCQSWCVAVEPPLVSRWLHQKWEPGCLKWSCEAAVLRYGPTCHPQRRVLVQLEWHQSKKSRSLASGNWAILEVVAAVRPAVVAAIGGNQSDLDPKDVRLEERRHHPSHAVVSARDRDSAGYPRSWVVETRPTASRTVRHLKPTRHCCLTPCAVAALRHCTTCCSRSWHRTQP